VATRGKSKQISFREKSELVEQLHAAALREDLTFADFVRKLFRFGFSAYEICGSLHALRERFDVARAAIAGLDYDRKAKKMVDEIEAPPKSKPKRKAG